MALIGKLASNKGLLLAGLLAAAGCTPTASSDGNTGNQQNVSSQKTSPVQMNDVSILYPLAKTAAEMKDYLLPTSKGAGGVLLPEAVFNDVAGKVRGIIGSVDYTTLRVVAIRLDPCFAQLGPITDPSSCEHQMRLIYQPVDTGSSASFGDSGFHAFYSLGSDEFDTVLKAIVSLRMANSDAGEDLGPLAVHPILAKQGLSGKMAKALNKIVQQYAGQANLSRLTGFESVFAQHTSWNFAADDVSASTPTASVIVGLDGSPTSETVQLGSAAPGLFSLNFPPTTTGDNVAPLLNVKVQSYSADVLQAALDSALRIENPNANSPNTIDCASCHVAEIARQLVATDFFKLSTTGDDNQFLPDPTYISDADFQVSYPAMQPDGLALNLHAFSYDGTTPMIIQRVINETAAIVANLNGATQAATVDLAQPVDMAMAPDLSQAPDPGSM